MVHFFRDVRGIYPITPQVLRNRTQVYKRWVEGYARNHKIPMEWAQKGVRKEDYVVSYRKRMQPQNGHGVYFIFQSMEQGPSFRSLKPKYANDDPNYRPIRRQRSRYAHFYFYILDEVLGPMVMCVGTFLPFLTTYYINGHEYIARQLRKEGIRFHKDDNAFLSVSNPAALQAAADRLSPEVIRPRLDYWTFLLGPKFSPKERKEINLKRNYSLNQVEYCRNFIFRRHFPIHQIYERSCDLGLARLSANHLAKIFAVRITKRSRGKLYSVLDQIDHGHHVLRFYCKNLIGRMYEKFSTFLRLEICVNRVKDLGLNKGLENLSALHNKLTSATDRFTTLEAESLNVHVDFALFQRLALPIQSGKSKIAGIKIHDTRMMRLMEVLLHAGDQLLGRRTADIYQALLTTFALTADAYSLTQLRYDLRKMKAHGLLERARNRYSYRLTDKGIKVSLMFILFHKRICGPLANSLFARRPNEDLQPPSKIETAYYKADHAIQEVIDLAIAALNSERWILNFGR